MDRPKPPTPNPPSEPTMRAAPPPLPRPRMQTDPEARTARNAEMLADAVQKLETGQAEQANFNKAVMAHIGKMERAWALEDDAPDGQSDPPPASTKKRRPRNKVDEISLDSIKAKYGVYLFFGLWAADKIIEHFHLFGAK